MKKAVKEQRRLSFGNKYLALIISLLLFFNVNIFAQFPNNSTTGNASTLYHDAGGRTANVGFVNTRYPDTLAINISDSATRANFIRISGQKGSQIIVGDIVYIRDSTAHKWIPIGTGSGGSGTDSAAFHSISQALDSSYAKFNRPNGTATVLKPVYDTTSGGSGGTPQNIYNNDGVLMNLIRNVYIPKGGVIKFTDSSNQNQLYVSNVNGNEFSYIQSYDTANNGRLSYFHNNVSNKNASFYIYAGEVNNKYNLLIPNILSYMDTSNNPTSIGYFANQHIFRGNVFLDSTNLIQNDTTNYKPLIIGTSGIVAKSNWSRYGLQNVTDIDSTTTHTILSNSTNGGFIVNDATHGNLISTKLVNGVPQIGATNNFNSTTLKFDSITGSKIIQFPNVSGNLATSTKVNGVTYNANANGLIDLGTVGNTYTASNGLTMVGNNVTLGGSLTGNTNIKLGESKLTIQKDSIGQTTGTSTNISGLILTNNAIATSIVPQQDAPTLDLRSSGWDYATTTPIPSVLRLRSNAGYNLSTPGNTFYPSLNIEGSNDGGNTFSPLATFTSRGGQSNMSIYAINTSFLTASNNISTATNVGSSNSTVSSRAAIGNQMIVGNGTGNTAVDSFASIRLDAHNIGFLPNRLTKLQRDSMAYYITSATIVNGGTGYTTAPNVFFSTSVSPVYSPSVTSATGIVTISGGSVTGVTITNAGYYNSRPNISFSGGGGTGAIATANIAQLTLPAGLTIYCTDCTATDSSTGVMQTYNGTTWKNNW